METQGNLAVQTIMNIVKNKYPNYQSNNTEKQFKINTFKDAISPKNKLKAFNFIDYSISYIVKNENIIPENLLVDDILTIAIIFSNPTNVLAELPQNGLDTYVKLIRNEGYAIMTILNKVMLNKDILNNMYYLRMCFTTESDYQEFINQKFSQVMLRYYILRKTNHKDEDTIKRLQSELINDFEKLFAEHQDCIIGKKKETNNNSHSLKLVRAASSQKRVNV